MWPTLCSARSLSRQAGARRFCSVSLPPLGLLRLRDRLDERIVGHHDLKDAVILALVCREHVYVEGPPGTAKTQLAETAARAAGLTTFVYQLHRDTRLHELVGDTVIMREPEVDGGEVIRQSLRPGGMLSVQLAVLDDISRAPGEALNVLFRVLNERRFCMRGGDMDLPLVTAIATGNPCSGIDDYYAEPLDPATLDRFTLHVRARGIIEADSWDEALRVMALHSGSDGNDTLGEKPNQPVHDCADADVAATLETAHAALPMVSFGLELREMLVQVLQAFRKEIAALQSSQSAAAGNGGGLLTDRTFLAKGPLICRAHALTQGRSTCIDEDLHAIRHLTAFRLPEQVHARADEIIDQVIREAKEKRNAKKRGSADDGTDGAAGSGSDVTSQHSPSSSSTGSASSQSQIPSQQMRREEELVHEGLGDFEETEQRYYPRSRRQLSQSILVPIFASLAVMEDMFRRLTGMTLEAQHAEGVAENLTAEGHVEPLLAAIAGRMRKRSRQRKRTALTIGASGQPRGWRTPRSVSEVGCGDLDGAAAAEWSRAPTPHLPPAVARQTSSRPGGRLAIIRDISWSMEGAHAIWASAVVSSLLQMCQRRSLSVGYLEFNQEPIPFRGGQRDANAGEFFTREYNAVFKDALQAQNDGGTNMQFALRAVINEYARSPRAEEDCNYLRELGRELFFGRIRQSEDSASIRSHTKLREYGIFLPSESVSGQRQLLVQRSVAPDSHVLLVTDGLPTLGCATFAAEREEAIAMGLCVHTVFIGDGEEYPESLGALARATGGVRFQAMIDHRSGSVKLLDREIRSAPQ